MRQSEGLWCAILLLLSTSHCGLSYFVTVDAHSEECFFDKVSSGTKLGLTFEVVEGGFLDIDVKVRRPWRASSSTTVFKLMCVKI